MESNIINIATLSIDRSGVEDSIVKTRQEIFELQKANAALRKDITKNGDVTGEQTRQFVENERRLRELTAQYRTQQAAINDVTLAELKESAALKENAKSMDQAVEQNKELKRIRGQLDVTTREGAEALALLNARIDENTRFINENKSESEKAAVITGNYRQKIFELAGSVADNIPGFEQARKVVGGFGDALGITSETVANFTASTVESVRASIGFRSVTNTSTQATQAQTVATEAQTTATEAQAAAQQGATVATSGTTAAMKLLKLAIIATGIGALVVGIVAIATALSQSESASNKFSRTMAGFKGIFNALLAVLRPVGEFLIDNIAKAFDFVGKAAEKTLGLISKALDFVGLEKASKAVDNFTNSVKSSVVASQRLADAEAKYNAAQRQSEKIQLDFQKRAEKIRQLRDDESKSIPERIKLNNQLGAVLKQQSGEELKIANQAVAIAQLRIRLTGKSTENLDALAEAQTRVSDIQERISGQESEQLSNLNSLRKEAADKAKEAADKERERKLKALNDSVIVFESEKRSLDEQLTFYKNYYAQLDKLQNGADRIKNQAEFSSKLLEIAGKVVDEELEQQKRLIDEKKKLSQGERDDLIANAEFLKKTETERVQSLLLSEVDKNTALEEIQKGYLESVAEINKKFAESEKLRKEEQDALEAIDFEMRLLKIQDQAIAESDIRKQILAAEYEEKQRLIAQDLENEKVTAQQATALKLLEDKRYAQAIKALDKEVAKTKKAAQFQIVQNSLEAAQTIFGESKGLAVASALVNTYQGITAELSTKAVTPYEIGLKVANVALVAANGFAAVKNILKTNKGSTGGGGGGSDSARMGGGVSAAASVFENPARTATVATVGAAPATDPAGGVQPVLVLETLDEVKSQQQIKIKSN